MDRPRRFRAMFVSVAALLVLSQVLVFSSPASAQDRPVLRFGTNSADLSNLDPHFASGT